ncbi:Rieske 2Fe-2S domain-containing protein [Salarchaeum sp. JOR-1]|uniref:Rieske (2Fe-2S) protein n=1 Tax=Salarchaeum sp. JOR-1 TaxID=2599399 RepID=UPI001198CBCD|nr:Rieske 2Fe-2S domain-containing protein [Salarchaeum sp. JOR-1]QDX40196.1 Rieske 2Fe-2S domain-containing protein [Salarchaeum sp. JOR-1]
MARAELTTVDTVHDERSWLFTVVDDYGNEEEVILVPCEDSVAAWVNTCPHEFQRFDRGMGAAMRDGQVICPKHGSMFDTCSGDCDNGEAAGTTLVDVSLTVEDGTVYLDDEDYVFRHEGGIDDTDGEPSSTSHLSF